MAKDKAINPATAHLKAEKAKALKKGKAAVAAQRTSRLATRNPRRLERSIEEIRAGAQGRDLNPREKKQVEELEVELAKVKKAREALGDKAPSFGPGNRQGQRDQAQGKRRREDDGTAARGWRHEDSDTDEDLKGIPWPRDRSPPVPEEVLVRLQSARGNSNMIPLGGTVDRMAGRGGRGTEPLPATKEEAKTVYEAKPQVRDLKKEAVRFAPSAVRRKIKAVKGEGGLVEEEEVARLEKEGYYLGGGLGNTEDAALPQSTRDLDALEEEERRFQSELRNVTMEDVDDENG